MHSGGITGVTDGLEPVETLDDEVVVELVAAAPDEFKLCKLIERFKSPSP